MVGGMYQMPFGAGMTGMSGMTGMPGMTGTMTLQPQLQAMMQMSQMMASPSSGATSGTASGVANPLSGYMYGASQTAATSPESAQAAYYASLLGSGAGAPSSDMTAMIANYMSGKSLTAGTSMSAPPAQYYGAALGANSGFSSADLSTMISNLMSGKVVTEGTSLSEANYMTKMTAALATINASASSATGEIGGGTDWGRSLAKDAEANATGTGGWCFKYAGAALRRFGVQTSGASAYMAGPQMAKSSKFHEVTGLKSSQLKDLPAGAVVVWDRSPGHEHGHISIALGDGREASDVIRKQATAVGTGSFRVFLPNQ